MSHHHHHGFELTSPISFHAHPLGLIQHAHEDTPRSSRSSSVAPPHSPPRAHLPSPLQQQHAKGASTSVEQAQDDKHDATRRPNTANAGSATAVTVGDGDDIEGQTELFTDSTDPYSLAARLKSPAEISSIRRSISDSGRSANGGLKLSGGEKSRGRAVQSFYEDQNDNIRRLLKSVAEHRRLARAEQESDTLKFKIAVRGSFAANLILAILQVYGAVSSGSLSLFTTMADAIFDPLSNLMLILSTRAMNRVDGRRFPSGKARIENAGNIVFCFLMTSVSLILIAFSARDLAAGSTEEHRSFHVPSVVAVGVAFVTKLCLFIYCYALREKYSQIRILWEDHRNDLLINGFGLLTSVGGSKLRWWIDPMGAIIISIIIAVLWLHTAYAEFLLLIGVSADTQMLQLITYISMTHSPLVIALDTVRAWHSGPRLIVEVDIVMDAGQSLKETHDVAEALQTKLESLPHVERAYVHVDFETSHAPEHFLKKEL